MYCKHCGKQISDDAKFCDGCGKPVLDNPTISIEPPEKKKSVKKKKRSVWLYAFIIIILLASCGAIVGDSEENPVDNTPIVTESIIQETYVAPTSNQTEILNVAVSYIEQVLKDNFGDYELTYDDTGINISLWREGIALGARFAASAGGENLKSWNDMIANFVDMSRNIRKYLDTLGLNNVTLSISILNDQNKDNILAMIVNDILIYDVVNDG